MNRQLRQLARAPFLLLDRGLNRLYGWRYNPLYQSGTIAVVLFTVLLLSGLYLLLFYRIGDPHGSVSRLTAQPWSGRWIRGLHRYASDAALVAIAVHAIRMFFQGRSWGPRALAWLTGVALLSIFLIAGWTGFVMVWDQHGLLLANEGARLLDALPLFSVPLQRTFVGEHPIAGAFFFVNLFAHIALPVGVAFLLWAHVSRLARPRLLPPRALYVTVLVLLLAAAIAMPVDPGAEADPFRIPASISLNLFYGGWLPLLRPLPAGPALAFLCLGMLAIAAVPLWSRPRREKVPPPSRVETAYCTGCEQCFLDCPYEAIAMTEGGRTGLVAVVDPALCVSCGICAGSCAPMGVGPPGRTGREQLAKVRSWIEGREPDPQEVVVVSCTQVLAPGDDPPGGAPAYPVGCAGNLHSSVIEYLLRAGWGGVAVVACPPRDCWSREGPLWLEERLFHEREAELKERVDRSRVLVVHAAWGDDALVEEGVAALRVRVRGLQGATPESDPEIEAECESPSAGGPVTTGIAS